MNIFQKTMLLIAILVIIVMGLYPPFYFRLENGMSINMGYSFIFDPPQYRSRVNSMVDIKLLITQWIGIAIITTMAISIFIKRGKK